MDGQDKRNQNESHDQQHEGSDVRLSVVERPVEPTFHIVLIDAADLLKWQQVERAESDAIFANRIF